MLKPLIPTAKAPARKTQIFAVHVRVVGPKLLVELLDADYLSTTLYLRSDLFSDQSLALGVGVGDEELLRVVFVKELVGKEIGFCHKF